MAIALGRYSRRPGADVFSAVELGAQAWNPRLGRFDHPLQVVFIKVIPEEPTGSGRTLVRSVTKNALDTQI